MNFPSSVNNLVLPSSHKRPHDTRFPYICGVMHKEDITHPQPINLGLPSGTLWADRNLGAESVTDYGDYYMWGSTEPDTDNPCDWEYAPFNGGFQWYNPDVVETFRKEAFPNGVLSDQYDAAHVHLGGKWHMPTKEQFQELLEYTNTEWVMYFNGSGINGHKFTSKTNGNSIFIPTAGYWDYSSVYYVGRRAHLWSSTLDSNDPSSVYYLYFNSDYCYVNNYDRFYGFCVRPVQ